MQSQDSNSRCLGCDPGENNAGILQTITTDCWLCQNCADTLTKGILSNFPLVTYTLALVHRDQRPQHIMDLTKQLQKPVSQPKLLVNTEKLINRGTIMLQLMELCRDSWEAHKDTIDALQEYEKFKTEAALQKLTALLQTPKFNH